MSTIPWSKYQLNFFVDVAKGKDDTKLEAVAGSGKSTSLMQGIRHIPSGKDALVTSFSKACVDDLKAKGEGGDGFSGPEIRTLNSLGYRACMDKFGRLEVDTERVYKVLDKIVGEAPKSDAYRSEFNALRFRIKSAVDLAKNHLADKPADIIALADEFEIGQEIPQWAEGPLGDKYQGEKSELFARLVLAAMEMCKKPTGGKIDFNDQLWLPVVLKLDLPKYDRVFIDEAQDCCPAQVEMLYRSMSKNGRLCAIGDDHQCIPAGQKIATPSGEVLVEKIKVGDVVSCVKNGKVVRRPVVAKSETQKEEAFEFDLGEYGSFQATKEHVCFASIDDPAGAFLYLMWRSDLGYRIGVSRTVGYHGRNFIVRTMQEGGERLWVLDWFPTYNEAAEAESYLSLEHQVPKEPFRYYGRNIWCDSDEKIRKLFGRFGQNGSKLLDRFQLDFERPNYFPKASGGKGRVSINLLLSTKDGHRVEVESIEIAPSVVKQLGMIKSKKGTWRLRKCFRSLRDAREFANKIKSHVVNSYIVESLACTGSYRRMLAVPATGVNVGMHVPIMHKGHAISVPVKARKIVKVRKCFDIEVEDLGNFIVNDVVVHNSIYGWRGAGIGMKPFERHKTNSLPLSISYRCPKAIVREAQKIVKHIETAPDAIEGMIADFRIDTLPGRIKAGDAILSRTNSKLVRIFFDFLQRSIPVTIQGRDLGASLTGLTIHSGAKSVAELRDFVEKWQQEEITLRRAKFGPTCKVDKIEDRAESMRIICSMSTSIEDVKRNIARLIPPYARQGSTEVGKVVLSSVHRAKGREWSRVFLVESSFATSEHYWRERTKDKGESAASKKWARERAAEVITSEREEANIRYVAVTRSKSELYLVTP